MRQTARLAGTWASSSPTASDPCACIVGVDLVSPLSSSAEAGFVFRSPVSALRSPVIDLRLKVLSVLVSALWSRLSERKSETRDSRAECGEPINEYRCGSTFRPSRPVRGRHLARKRCAWSGDDLSLRRCQVHLSRGWPNTREPDRGLVTIGTVCALDIVCSI